MTDEFFKIYVDRLKHGETYYIDAKFPLDFLDVNEKELKFLGHVQVKGRAYLADSVLMIHFDVINTECEVPCSICNKMVLYPLTIRNAYYSIPMDEIHGSVYNFSEILRESILLDTPVFTECHGGKCPERETFKKYLSLENPDSCKDGYQPFADL